MQSQTSPTFCVLLAGGQGSRLHELTAMDCKPAVPFAGARLVDFTMANAARSGLRHMLVALQYRPQLLARHLRAVWGPQFPAGLALHDGMSVQPGGYRGTADAVRAHLPDLTASGADEVLVLSADHVYQMDYRAMLHRHRESGAKLTVAVDEIPLAQAGRFGVLTADAAGRVTAFDEKPRHPQPIADRPTHALVSMGIYVIDRLWLSDLLRRTDMDDFGQDVLPEAVAQGVVQVHRTGADFYWRDVGTLDSYRLAQLDFLATGTPPLLVPASAHLPGREVRRAAGQGNVLLPGAHLGRRARVRQTILAPGAMIPDGMVIGEDPDEDRRWFRVTPGGTVLVTQSMLARRRAEQQRPCQLPFYPLSTAQTQGS